MYRYVPRHRRRPQFPQILHAVYDFARACLGKKHRNRVVDTADGQVTRHRTIELETVFETVNIPSGIVRLDTALVKVN